MILGSPYLQRLVDAFRRLPGVGGKTAERYALHLLAAPPGAAEELASALVEARHAVCHCGICRNLSDSDPCRVCADPRRDHGVICVVERPAGAMAIERGGVYRGVYHVLHGAINPLEHVGPEELRVDLLLQRLRPGETREVILATNATTEGETTAHYLSRLISPLGIRVTRIAHGVPIGGGLEYADEATLMRALEGRGAI
ncbi:MAG TPA: recombination mediator RecR [Candidatus Hydrogenedentes bacterium]|nr:recombination protein RecR [Candidatus Hydrogenedentota bacterium]HOJ69524.1 recombination mediator RecR [Candidatus Hydrogenedentota bacterium]HOK88558.1 recombination mediator RecR [Candidatus Hydrogenedentota bacterium]